MLKMTKKSDEKSGDKSGIQILFTILEKRIFAQKTNLFKRDLEKLFVSYL